MATKKQQKLRRRRAVTEAPLDDLLQSLTVDQLRAIARKLDLSLEGQDLRLKQSIVDTLEEQRDSATVRETAYEIEASTPYSNYFFAGLEAGGTQTKLKSLTSQRGLEGEGIKRVFQRDLNGRFLMIFEHQVSTREWVFDQSRGGYFPSDGRIRHPLITWIDSKLGTIAISYPGFNQGSVESDQRIDYETVIGHLLSLLKSKAGIGVAPLPIRGAINELCDRKSPRLNIIGANPENLAGIARIRVRSRNQIRNSIDTWLTDNIERFGPSLDRTVLSEAIYRFVREMSQEVISVHWLEEKISSRVSTWEIGTEFHFTWEQIHRSYHLIDSITSLLLDTGKSLQSGTARAAWDYIVALADDEWLKPTSLVEKFNITAPETKHLITNALNAGLIRPVFRLRTQEDVQDLANNDWQDNAALLKKEFRLQTGHLIDGRDPKNIEIAFARKR